MTRGGRRRAGGLVQGTLTAVVALGLVALTGTGGSATDPLLDGGADAAESAERAKVPAHRVDLAFVGDIHTLRRVNYSGQRPGGQWDFTAMFTEVAPLLRSADTAVCHMEAPIAPPGSPVIVVPPLLSTAAPMADALAGAGFDRCSTAGNHIMDRGVAGIDATLTEFDRVGISQSGAARSAAEARPEAAIYDVDGVRVAHLSYSWYIGGQSVPASQPWRANTLSAPRVVADARAARAAGAQVVVTSFTWGFDKIVAPTGYQRSVAQAVTASGEVDLIVGQQAHVLQPIEQVNGVWVIYGMGNFLSDHPVGSFPQSAGDAAIFVVGVVVGADGSVRVRPPIAYPTWIDKSDGHVIRPVGQRFDPGLDASTRAALQRSLDRTRSVLGPYVFERA